MQENKKDISPRELFKNIPTPINVDPQGSYTGRPLDVYEIPVQDADDL